MIMKYFRALMVLVCLEGGVGLGCPLTVAFPQDRMITGWIEKVRIIPSQLLMPAKLDTGADVSSLHALDIKELQRNGERWVQFTLSTPKGKTATIERKVVRDITITRHQGRQEIRPVVMLGVCLGTVYKEVEVNLVNRTGLKYPMLIGRSFMGESLLIDPSKEFVSKPTCKESLVP